jgi:hypothetical protein
MDTNLIPERVTEDEQELILFNLEHNIRSEAATTFELGQDDTFSVLLGAVILSAGQRRAFAQPHYTETSFRAGFGAALRRLVVLRHRLDVEARTYRERANTSYLWQTHIAALRYLLAASEAHLASSLAFAEQAAARGLTQHRDDVIEATQALQVAMCDAGAVVKESTDRHKAAFPTTIASQCDVGPSQETLLESFAD